MFQPKLFTTLKDYSRKQFLSDLIAGIIVGIVALPLAIAFGIASGVSPEKGLITAIIAGFIISALGGSRVQIGGPTGAFIVIVYGIVQKYGVEGLTIATIIAGVMLMAIGFARLGTVIKFIPYPVTVGFTSGIAVIIFSSQIKDFLGLSIGALPADFIEKWVLYFQNFESINLYALGIALFTVVIIIYWPKITTKIPGSLIAILFCTFAVQFFNLPVETIGTRFGEIPSSIPFPKIPVLNFNVIRELIQPAFTIAMLGAIESLLSAVVADGMIGGRHRSNMELVAQGAANIITPILGGIPATGAIARTATNVKNGGRTPIAGIIHAVTLLLILLFLGKWAKLIPLSCLAGVLVMVAYNMSEWKSFMGLLKSPRSDVAVLLITFFLTVVFDLTVAIEVGLLLAVVLFMGRISKVTNIGIIEGKVEGDKEDLEGNALANLDIPHRTQIYEINGPFFFGIAHKFEEAMHNVSKQPKVRIIRLRKVPFIDSTALYNLKQLYLKSKKDGIVMILSGVNPQPMDVIKNTGLYEMIGKENIFDEIAPALERAKDIVSNK